MRVVGQMKDAEGWLFIFLTKIVLWGNDGVKIVSALNVENPIL